VPDTLTIIAITGTFLLAGAVKGVIGLGLPTLSLGLLVATFDLTTAIALMIVPSFVTNLWQSVVGGRGRAVLLRIWPFLSMATAGIWLSASALIRFDVTLLAGLLGGLLIIYAAVGIAGVRLSIPRTWETWSGLLLGTANGLLAGMTGSFVVPGLMYLQGLEMDRHAFVQAMGMLFTASTVALALRMHSYGLLSPRLGLLSIVATLPALLGMAVGQRLRARLSEQRFRQIFFVAILTLGAYIVGEAASGS